MAATHVIRTTFRPNDEITVGHDEYEDLLERGLIYDGTPPVEPADPFDVRFAEYFDDPDSVTMVALRTSFAPPIDEIRFSAGALVRGDGDAIAPGGGVAGASFWQLRDGTVDGLVGWCRPPAHWTSVNVEAHIFWTGDPGSVDVVLASLVRSIGNGDRSDSGSLSWGGQVTVPYGVQQFGHQWVTLSTNLAIDPSKYLYTSVSRLGSDSADTYPANLGLIELIVSNAG